MFIAPETVVICLKICTFAVATTTDWLQGSAMDGCDLLENLYLCGSNNNTSGFYRRHLKL